MERGRRSLQAGKAERRGKGATSPAREERRDRRRRPKPVGNESRGGGVRNQCRDVRRRLTALFRWAANATGRTTPLSQGTGRGRTLHSEPRRPGRQPPGPKVAATASPGRRDSEPLPRTTLLPPSLPAPGSQGRGEGGGGDRAAGPARPLAAVLHRGARAAAQARGKSSCQFGVLGLGCSRAPGSVSAENYLPQQS